MKKPRQRSIHQPWPLSLPRSFATPSLTLVLSPRRCFTFQPGHGVTQSGSYNNVINHISSSPSTEPLKYAIGPVIKGSVCVGVNVPLAPL